MPGASGRADTPRTCPGAIEAQLERLSTAVLARRGQFVRSLGVETWPDATLATRYGFLHALYHEVLYERLAAGRRLRLHQRIGLHKESAYGARASDIAAELALHCIRAQDAPRGVPYVHAAARNAMHRCAYQEAITHVHLGLELLPKLDDTRVQTRREVILQTLLAQLLHITRGSWAAEGWSRCSRGSHQPWLWGQNSFARASSFFWPMPRRTPGALMGPYSILPRRTMPSLRLRAVLQKRRFGVCEGIS